MRPANLSRTPSAAQGLSASIFAANGVSRKRFANLQAHAALAGIAVHPLPTGGYRAIKLHQVAHLCDVDALAAWLTQQGVRHVV